MASSTKKPKGRPGPKKKRFTKRQVVIVLAAILLVVVVGWLIYQDRQEHSRKVSNLEKARIDLGVIKSDLESRIQSPVQQSEHCYRTAEKFGNGWIVCEQSISLSGTAKSDEQLHRDASQIVGTVDQNNKFRQLPTDTLTRGPEDGLLRKLLVPSEGSKNYPYCRIDYVAYLSSYWKTEKRGMYAFELSCLESHLNNFAYDELKPES